MQNVVEAIQAGRQLERIYIQNSLRDKNIDKLQHLAHQYKIPVNYVPVVTSVSQATFELGSKAKK